MAGAFPTFSFKPKQPVQAVQTVEPSRQDQEKEKGDWKRRNRDKRRRSGHHHAGDDAGNSYYWIDTAGGASTNYVCEYAVRPGLPSVHFDRKRRDWKKRGVKDTDVLFLYDGEFVPCREYSLARKVEFHAQIQDSPSPSIWHEYIRNEQRLLECTKELHKSLADEKVKSMYETAHLQFPSEYSLAERYITRCVDQPNEWCRFVRANIDNDFSAGVGFQRWIDACFTFTSGLSIHEMVDMLVKQGVIDLAAKYGESQLLAVVYQLAGYLRDSGHVYRAVAIYQGLVEMSLFRPDAVSDEQGPMALRQYWNMETKRFGDLGASKWRFTSPTEHVMVDNPAFEKYFPIRSVDAKSEGDLPRVVLFRDIEPFMFIVQNHTALIFNMMALFGAKTPLFDSESSSQQTDHQVEVVVELIRQLTHSKTQLTEEYLVWSFEYLAKHSPSFYPKYAQHMLKKYSSPGLYQLYGSLQWRLFSEKSVADKINQTLSQMPVCIPAWSRWVVDELEMNADPDLARLLNYASRDSLATDTLVRFVLGYLEALGNLANMHIRVEIALTNFWLANPSNEYICQVARILLTNNRLGAKLLKWHLESAIEAMPFPYLKLREAVVQFNSLYPCFQLEYFAKKPSYLDRLRSALEKDDYYAARQVYLDGLQHDGWNAPMVTEGLAKLVPVLSTLEQTQIKNVILERDLIN